MAQIKLTAFSGEQPRILPRLLPATAAQAAINVRLDNGALTPYRGPTVADSITPGDDPFGTIVLHGDDWLGFPGTVHAARGPVDTDRLYYTGDGKPKLRIDDTTTYDLELNPPATAPTATLGGSGSGDVITRIYVYTFVTDLGEESEPCPASNEIAWQAGNTVTISGIEDAPGSPERGISKQRFYRSQSGTVGTDFYFIAERDVSDGDFSDTVAADAFAEPVPSRNWSPPPDDLAGLIALPNGMMAAFSGKKLYFCEPFRPHAWPEIYVLTTDVPIVALAASGTTVWVLTETTPYRVTGTSPDTMVMDKVEANLPCINARGVVDLGFAIAWPSPDGLAVARADGTLGLATQNLFSPREWRRLNPGTMRGGQIEGRWVGSYDGTTQDGTPISGSLIIDLAAQSFLIRSSVKADSWFYDIASGLAYFLDAAANTVKLFDSATGNPDTLYWRSKEFVLPRPDTFGAILVETGPGVGTEAIAARQAEIDAAIAANELLLAEDIGIGGDVAGATVGELTVAGDILNPVPASLGSTATVHVYADGELVASVGTLDRVARLPSGFSARIWEIDAFADIELTQITMARTVDELKLAAGAS